MSTTTSTPATFDDVWQFTKSRCPHISLRDLDVPDSDTDSDLAEACALATAIIQAEDHRQAPTSETALLGAALKDLHEAAQGKQQLLDVLAWWADAYDAWEIEDSERIYDLIFDGRSDDALALAGTEV